MKYKDYITIENIVYIYRLIKKNIKNKSKIEKFENYFSINIYRIYINLLNNNYKVNNYNVFTIKEPKVRIIMSQNIEDKIVNNFVSYYYLIPLLENSLIDTNVASRKNKGSRYAIYKLKEYLNEIKEENFYILKCDIKKFFYNIDHNKLKEILNRKIKDRDIIKIINNIIDSTNGYNIYEYNKGLPIGSMSSQILAIYYLNEMDHYIKEKLHIKYYIRYMDDFILIHKNKEYLKYCLKEIERILKEYKLELNSKTIILNKKSGLNFLGYRFIIKNKLRIKIISRNKYKIKKKLKYLENNDIEKYKKVLSSYKGYFKYIK